MCPPLSSYNCLTFDTEGRPRYRRRKPSVALKYRQPIEAKLVADRDASRKQRHTAHRIWIPLRKEVGRA